ncbi:hypothetical protein Franean1_3733 [Parafrankia sp. EAN1pec]|nr:hypothetical protein Franean1_3733 [Frankia sp. EAN1pec]
MLTWLGLVVLGAWPVMIGWCIDVPPVHRSRSRSSRLPVPTRGDRAGSPKVDHAPPLRPDDQHRAHSVQNIRRGHYELAIETEPRLRLSAAFTDSLSLSDHRVRPGPGTPRLPRTQQPRRSSGTYWMRVGCA